jgi:hypothetical protein
MKFKKVVSPWGGLPQWNATGIHNTPLGYIECSYTPGYVPDGKYIALYRSGGGTLGKVLGVYDSLPAAKAALLAFWSDAQRKWALAA